MKKPACLMLLAATAITAGAKQQITLADNADKMPVAGAAVISAKGVIIGVTDNDGRIGVAKADYPLSIRSLGYEAASVTNAEADSVFLTPAAYSLAEVTVTPYDRPVTRVVTYLREYTTGAVPGDTMQIYNEYMLDYFFAEGKVKGFKKSHESPNTLAVRRYGRIAKANGQDSVMRPDYDDVLSRISLASSFAFVPNEQKSLTEAMMAGARCDTVQGKHFPKFVYRLSNGYFTLDCDALSDYKTHAYSLWLLKAFGMTMEIQDARWTMIYKQNDSGKYGLGDFIYGTGNLHVLGSGKLFKKMVGVKDAIHINCYFEQYPVEIQHLTAEEYNVMKKDYYKRTEEFVIPDNAQPLPPAIQELVDRVNREASQEARP